MSNYLQQRQINASAGLNYSALQSKKKLQPIIQQSQQQQQLMQAQSQNQNQQAAIMNSQAYSIQNSQNMYGSVNSNSVGTLNGVTAVGQGNSQPFLNNYYFGSSINNTYQGNQLQHSVQQQNQNSNKQLSSSSSPKSYFGQNTNSITNSSNHIDNSIGMVKQKANISSLSSNLQNHSTMSQQQFQQQQQQGTGSLQAMTPQSNSQTLTPIAQSPSLHAQNLGQADLLLSPNQAKNKKLYIDTNNNFYFSQQNAATSMTNQKQGGNLSTQSSQSGTVQKGFGTLRKNQQKVQRSPNIQSQQQPNLISQSAFAFLSNNSPSTTANPSGLNFLNSSGSTLLNSNAQNGNFSLNLSSNTLNSSNSPNNGMPYSDETRFIKKTQHFVKGLTTQSGTCIGNNQEEIDDLDESVIEMMKEYNLYEQAQKGIIPDADPTKFSVKRNGIVSCYAAKTHQGLVRNYNEDRVSIILNIMKPQNRQTDEQWPKCSFFGVYDGHGGVNCADFLRDHLHQYVIKDSNFPWNPKEAIKNGFEQAEIQFLKQSQTQMSRTGQVDRSGSCALVVLIVGETCYVANVGDSRAVLSQDGGKNVCALTRDHKPMDEVENQRIHDNGGKVYQTKIQQIATTDRKNEEPQTIVGPYRVLPGRLSVTRTFGDIEAKLPRYGGNPKVVISTPEIKSFKIQPNHDFIIIGCDGIYDKITSQEIGQIVWDTSKNESLGENVHEFSGKSVENIMKLSIARKTLDNITVVMIGFDNLERVLFDESTPSTEAIQPSSAPTTQLSSETAQSLANQAQMNTLPASPHTQLHSLTAKNQKILQNISSALNGPNSQTSTSAPYGLNMKNNILSQSALVDNKKATHQINSQTLIDKLSKSGNFTNLGLNHSQTAPLTEKDSNLENIESKGMQQQGYLGLGARLSLSNQSKKRVTENGLEDVSQSTGIKHLNQMNRTGNIARAKAGLDYPNGNPQLSPLYQTQQISTNKLKHSTLITSAAQQPQISQLKGLQTLGNTSDGKLRQSLLKNLTTK